MTIDDADACIFVFMFLYLGMTFLYWRLFFAICRHRNAKRMDRCWENDNELYIAAGLPAKQPCTKDITEEEHRAACDEYRSGLPLKRRSGDAGETKRLD